MPLWIVYFKEKYKFCKCINVTFSLSGTPRTTLFPSSLYLLCQSFVCCQVVLGLHIVRGDNICVVGEIDEEMDQRLGNNQQQQQHNELSLFWNYTKNSHIIYPNKAIRLPILVFMNVFLLQVRLIPLHFRTKKLLRKRPFIIERLVFKMLTFTLNNSSLVPGSWMAVP